VKEDEIKRRLAIYKREHTEKVSPPTCDDCNEYATLYDTLAGENYCDRCLDKSLRADIKELKEHTDHYV
jgi:hypothetical protein